MNKSHKLTKAEMVITHIPSKLFEKLIFDLVSPFKESVTGVKVILIF